jgi:hypothetical protein
VHQRKKRRMMKSNINVARLYEVVSAPIDSFRDFGHDLTSARGQLVYIDRGASILGVAHLDSVGGSHHFDELLWQGQHVVFTEGLDDRLGAYILLDVLPKMGIECDVLLTDNEESCRSTAEYFKPEKEYNWMFQFDRAGTDTVMYEYEDDWLIKELEEVGMIWGFGSYSDICEMEHLGIKGINVGTGYYDNHTPWSHAVITETDMMIRLFQKFYDKWKDVKLKHEKSSRRSYSGYGYTRGWNSACSWDGGPAADDERDNFSRFVEVEVPEGKVFVPQWRLSQYLFENPTAKISDPDYIKPVAATRRIVVESKAQDQAYDLAYLEALENGYTTKEASIIADRVADSILTEEEDISPYDDKCLVCGDPSCPGLDSCEVCGQTTHGDIMMQKTGLCSNCHAKIVADEDRSVWM